MSAPGEPFLGTIPRHENSMEQSRNGPWGALRCFFRNQAYLEFVCLFPLRLLLLTSVSPKLCLFMPRPPKCRILHLPS